MDIRILRDLPPEQLRTMGYAYLIPMISPSHSEEKRHDTQPSQLAKYPPVISFRISDDVVSMLNEITNARDKTLQEGIARIKYRRRYKRVTRAFIIEQLIKAEYKRMKEERKL